MKKLISLCLVIVLAFSLAACGGGSKETTAPQTQAPETEAPQTQAPETEAPQTQAPETKAPETEVPETQPEESTSDETEAGAAAIGTWDGNTYTSETLGITVTLPDSYVSQSDFTDMGIVTLEWMMQDDATASNLTLMVVHLEGTGAEDATEQDFIDQFKAQASATDGAVVGDDVRETTIAGDTYYGFDVELSGMIQSYHLHKVGEKIIIFLVTLADPAEEADLLNCVSPLK